MQRPRWITIVVLALLVLLVWWWLRKRPVPADHAAQKRERPELLLNRAWLGAPPKDDDKRRFRHAFIAIDAVPLGVFQRASAYRIEAERFSHDLDGNKLGLHFPQSDKRASVTFHITRCNDVPDFDLCLTLDKNPWGGPRRYYGQRNPDQRVRTLRAKLRRRALSAR